VASLRARVRVRPKLGDPPPRYVLTTFSYGSLLGPAHAARHMRGVSAHELGATANRHFTIEKLNRAIADVITAYLQLDLARVWGDASSVAADGTQIDTLIDNLLAEQHISYGGYGGIAYHHVADNYIALFSHFIPCGVSEAVYIIEGLLKQSSDANPDTIHADTQGHSYPVHALAHLIGFELLPANRLLVQLEDLRDLGDGQVLVVHPREDMFIVSSRVRARMGGASFAAMSGTGTVDPAGMRPLAIGALDERVASSPLSAVSRSCAVDGPLQILK
jgi:hypothetical protein